MQLNPPELLSWPWDSATWRNPLYLLGAQFLHQCESSFLIHRPLMSSLAHFFMRQIFIEQLSVLPVTPGCRGQRDKQDWISAYKELRRWAVTSLPCETKAMLSFQPPLIAFFSPSSSHLPNFLQFCRVQEHVLNDQRCCRQMLL